MTTRHHSDLQEVSAETLRRRSDSWTHDTGGSPLSVTALGRSGSTWLMHLLAQHTEISAVKEYPYEHVPARNAFLKYEADGDLALMLSTINDVYGSASYFAEKNFPSIETARSVWPDLEEIFLIRDFRDVVVSSLAFNNKRGFAAFGREKVGSDVDFVYHRAAMATPWIRDAWLARGDQAVLVKYEDLVAEPIASLRQLFERIGLAPTHREVEDLYASAHETSSALRGHKTAATGASSVGRWRTEMSAELQTACDDAFGELLTLFGYN